MRLARTLALAGAALFASIGFLRPSTLAQDAAPTKAGAPAAARDPGAELAAALKASPGCLGVEVAFTQSRKAVIFAWFKDKAAALDWYYSDYHQTAMMGLQEAAEAERAEGEPPPAVAGNESETEGHEPLAYVPDDVGPILCIATITPNTPGAKQLVPGFAQSISQISIELYAPLPGGIAFNGRFSPAALKVPHMVEFSAGGEKSSAPVPGANGAGK